MLQRPAQGKSCQLSRSKRRLERDHTCWQGGSLPRICRSCTFSFQMHVCSNTLFPTAHSVCNCARCLQLCTVCHSTLFAWPLATHSPLALVPVWVAVKAILRQTHKAQLSLQRNCPLALAQAPAILAPQNVARSSFCTISSGPTAPAARN